MLSFVIVFVFFFRFGRRFVVLLAHLLLLLFGVSSAFSPDVYVYIVLKFLCGVSVAGILTNAFVIGQCGCGQNPCHDFKSFAMRPPFFF